MMMMMTRNFTYVQDQQTIQTTSANRRRLGTEEFPAFVRVRMIYVERREITVSIKVKKL